MAGVRHGVATNQDRFENDQPETRDRLRSLVGCPFHIHRHLGSGVEGFQKQLGLQQFNTLNRLDQFVVFKSQTLSSFDSQMGAVGLLQVG